MQMFNKTFFRFAFGFIGIILFSVVVIVMVNSLSQARNESASSINAPSFAQE